MEELGGRVHVPLSVTQLGSGDWLTLSVDRRQLSDTIEQLLVEENGVEAVVRQDGTDASAAQTLRFELTLTRSSTVYDAFQTGNTQALDRIVRTWIDRTHVALVPVVRSDPPTIEVDWQTLTLELIERLNALPEVEAAQPNYSQMRESTAGNTDTPLWDVPRSD